MAYRAIDNGCSSSFHTMIVGYRSLNNERTDASCASAVSTRWICRPRNTKLRKSGSICPSVSMWPNALLATAVTVSWAAK
eukprot:scaffold18220_cov16-Prasinocladus_malaysianus.AAC.2